MQTINTGDGCRIAYRLDGASEAPVLLLSNSLGTDMRMWDLQLEAFSRHFRVLRYDSRGHGRSSSPDGAYSMDRLGRDVIELLDALSIESVHFCGLSLGGMIGQWLGIREPARLRRTILANTSAFMGPASAWNSRIATVMADGMASVADASVARWFTDSFQAEHADAIAPVKAMLSNTLPTGYAGCCAAIRDMDMRNLTQLITATTLIIGGRSDPATPLPHSEALAASIKGAKLVVLDAAHLSNIEQAKAFEKACLDFLTT